MVSHLDLISCMDGPKGLERDRHHIHPSMQGYEVPEPWAPEPRRQAEGLCNTILAILGSLTGGSCKGFAAYRGGSGEISVICSIFYWLE